jgi:hypothetical protein
MVGVYEHASVLDTMEFEEELSMPGWPSSFVMWANLPLFEVKLACCDMTL